MMFIRAVMSFIMPMTGAVDNKLTQFIYMTTEMVVSPIRNLFDRFSWFQSSFFDVPFFVTYVLLELVKYLLGRFR